jgi:hypothetical protein
VNAIAFTGAGFTLALPIARLCPQNRFAAWRAAPTSRTDPCR